MSRNYPTYKAELAEQLPAMFNNGESVQEVCLKLGIDEKTFDDRKAR